MGNVHLSCISGDTGAGTRTETSFCMRPSSHNNNTNTVITVVHCIEQSVLKLPCNWSTAAVQVGELMLDYPGHFVAELISLSQLLLLEQSSDGGSCSFSSKRAVAMAAHVELAAGHSYVLLPMAKLHSPLPAQDWMTWAQLAAYSCSNQSINIQYNANQIGGEDITTPISYAEKPKSRQLTASNNSTILAARSPGRSRRVAPVDDNNNTAVQVEAGSVCQACILDYESDGCNFMLFNSSTSSCRRSASWRPRLESISETSV